jgi:putative DNA primase/helicase
MRDIAERGTDVDYAAFFVRRVRGKLLYNYSARSWMPYDGKRWHLDDAGDALRFAKDVAIEMLRQASSLKDDALRIRATKNALSLQNRKRLDAMLYLAQPDLSISPAAFDRDEYLFNVTNGTLNLRTRELHPHDPKDRISKLSPAIYDPTAKCPRWEAFVSEIMQGNSELVTFLKRFIGLCLTGVVIEHFFAIFHGSGLNGKSTFLDVGSVLLGDYNVAVDPALFTERRHETGPSPELVRLNGVRFVSASELPEGGRLAEARMKRLTGGDPISARDLFQSVIQF